MIMRMRLRWTPAKLFGYLALTQAAGLTYLLKDASILLSSVPTLAALMANKAYQDDRRNKAKDIEHVFEFTLTKLWAFYGLMILGAFTAFLDNPTIYNVGLPSLCLCYGIKEAMNANKAVRAATGGGTNEANIPSLERPTDHSGSGDAGHVATTGSSGGPIGDPGQL